MITAQELQSGFYDKIPDKYKKPEEDFNIPIYSPSSEGLEDWRKQTIKLGAQISKLRKKEEI